MGGRLIKTENVEQGNWLMNIGRISEGKPSRRNTTWPYFLKRKGHSCALEGLLRRKRTSRNWGIPEIVAVSSHRGKRPTRK